MLVAPQWAGGQPRGGEEDNDEGGWVTPPSHWGSGSLMPETPRTSGSPPIPLCGLVETPHRRRQPPTSLPNLMSPAEREHRAELRRRRAREERQIAEAADEGHGPWSRHEARILARRERRLAWGREYAARRRAERRALVDQEGWVPRGPTSGAQGRGRDGRPSYGSGDSETAAGSYCNDDELFGEAPGQWGTLGEVKVESSAAGPADLRGESVREEPEHSLAEGVIPQDDLLGAPDASVVLVGEEGQPPRGASAYSSRGGGVPSLLSPGASVNQNTAVPQTEPLSARSLGSRAEVVDDGLASACVPTTDVGVQAGLSAWDRFSRGVQAVAKTLKTGLQAIPETLETGTQAGAPFAELLDGSCMTATLHRHSVGTQTPVH